MPRNLPWKNNVSTNSKPRPKNSTKPAPILPKGKRDDLSDFESDSDEEENPRVSRGKEGAIGSRAPSSSPPPNPPPESFMRDGLDQDDKYRLVEDELLAIAQKFTRHLHNAEYKEQQKMVHSQNKQTIKSISRPTVGVMPDNLKRRKEGAERTEIQRNVLSGMAEKADKGDDDSDSADGLPYIGTTLHGLMDSPRKRGVVLSKFAPPTTKSRSAAGYKKSGADDSMQASPVRKPAVKEETQVQDEVVTSSGEDDDLSAPVKSLFKREASSPAVPKTSHPHAFKLTSGSIKPETFVKREKSKISTSKASHVAAAPTKTIIGVSTTKNKSSQIVSGPTKASAEITTTTTSSKSDMQRFFRRNRKP